MPPRAENRQAQGTKSAVLLILAVIVVGVALVLLARRKPPPDPVFEGKPVTAWALDLNSPVAATRDKATETIGRMDSNAVPALVHLLRTPDPPLAKVARWVAPRLPTKLGRAILRIVNPSEAPMQRASAAQALRIMGPHGRSSVLELSRALEDDSTVAWHAALALARFGQTGTVALTAELPRTAAAQRGYICYALGTQGWAASNAAPALATVLEEGKPPASETAAGALTHLGHAAVPGLLHACKHQDPYVRVLAIHALGALGPQARDAVTNLIEIARDPDPSTREAAVEAISSMQPNAPAVRDCLILAAADSSRDVRMKALEGLSRTRSNDAVIEAVVRLSKDSSPDIRAAAATSLGDMTNATNRTVPVLREILQDPNYVVQQKAREALQRLHQLPAVNTTNGPEAVGAEH